MTELKGSATASASSYYPGYPPANAIDGNTGNDWMANGSSVWFQLDWAAPVTIREIGLIGASYGGADAWTYPKFTFSDASIAYGFPIVPVGSLMTYVLIQPKTTTSLRITINSYGGYDPGYAGFNEVYINDAYTTNPVTNLTYPDGGITASSTYGAYYPPRAIDGNDSTEWMSNGEGVNSWLRFNYNQEVQIEEVQLRSTSAADESWGKPRFRYSDNTYEDGADIVSESGLTTYTLTPKLTTSLKIETWANYDSYPALVNVVITGQANPAAPGGARINATGIQIIG